MLSAVLLGSIEEEQPRGSVICNIPSILQREERFNYVKNDFVIQFYEKHSTLERLFVIEEESGNLLTTTVIDLENVCDLFQLCCETDQMNLPNCQLIFLLKYFSKTMQNKDLQLLQASVIILDVNDHSPSFPNKNIERQVNENLPSHYRIALPLAMDKDRGRNGVVHYSMTGRSSAVGKETFLLKIERKENEEIIGLSLVTQRSLDRETISEIHLEILARDGGGKTDKMEVVVKVLDDNDCVPQFVNLSKVIKVAENSVLYATIAEILATDCDEGENSRLSYSLKNISPTQSNVFIIDPDSGRISLIGSLDRESVRQYELQIIVRDNGIARSLTSRELLMINVTDVNDNPPKIELSSRGFRVKENADKKTLVGTVTVKDADEGVNSLFDCQLVAYQNIFALHKFVGASVFKIETKESLDRESKETYDVPISCLDHGTPALSSIETIKVLVEDENDHSPVFQFNEYVFPVAENLPIGSRIGRIQATDMDFGRNGDIRYYLTGDYPQLADYVFVDPRSGDLLTKIVFDHETLSLIRGQIMAVDSANDSLALKTVVGVTFTITDENDNDPIFQTSNPLSIQVHEDSLLLHVLARIQAKDEDSDQNGILMYETITETNTFQTTREDGDLQLVSALDRERKSHYEVLIRASDRGIPRRRSSTLTLNIDVLDINDCSPEFVIPKHDITMNMSSSISPGSIVLRVLATDCDEGDNAKIRYLLVPYNLTSGSPEYSHVVETTFELNEMTGELRVVKSLSDKYSSYVLKFMARDMGSPSLNTTRLIFLKVIHYKTNGEEWNHLDENGQSKSTNTQTHYPYLNQTIVFAFGGLAILILLCLLAVAFLLLHRRLILICRTRLHERASLTPPVKDSYPQDVKYAEYSRISRFTSLPRTVNGRGPPLSDVVIPNEGNNTLLRSFLITNSMLPQRNEGQMNYSGQHCYEVFPNINSQSSNFHEPYLSASSRDHNFPHYPPQIKSFNNDENQHPSNNSRSISCNDSSLYSSYDHNPYTRLALMNQSLLPGKISSSSRCVTPLDPVASLDSPSHHQLRNSTISQNNSPKLASIHHYHIPPDQLNLMTKSCIQQNVTPSLPRRLSSVALPFDSVSHV